MPRYEQEADRSPSSPLYTPKHIAAIKRSETIRDIDGAYRRFPKPIKFEKNEAA